MLRTASRIAPVVLLSLAGVLLADDAEFWYPQCDSLPGSRMRYHAGKQWPLEPRPCGPSEPCVHRYHTAHYWPDPYRWQDRMSVRTHFAAQSAAGWMTNTTLYDQHFDPATQELNDSGRVHLRWILLYAPPQRRTPWVQAGDVAQISQTRLASVQNEAAAILGADAPIICLRVCQPYGAPAQEVDLVRRSYLTTIPEPRISYPQPQGGSGGGSGSGGAPQAGR
ncbi:MAG TPA: hypothetical protein VKU82_04605 [Planctomycetaceae bacterium]|nr:hypothetical protein [Planctomycetaceae bacterium]